MISRWVIGFFAVAASLAVGLGYLASQALEPVRPGTEATTQLFSIEPGQGLGQVARRLERAGLIKDARALSLLAQARAACGGDLDRLVRVVKLTGFVNSAPDFGDQPKVINGASDFMVEASFFG